MSQFVERIIRISYDPDDIKPEHVDVFHQALGRMVAFQMTSDTPRTLEGVNLAIDKNLEITGSYWQTWNFHDHEVYAGHKDYYAMDNALAWLRMGRAFVMGAVPRDGATNYSFHS